MEKTYIFYVDIYFLQNFIMKLGVLFLTIKTLKIQTTKPVLKVLGSAAVATILEIAGVFLIPNYVVYVLLGHCIQVPSMLCFIMWRQRENLGKAVVCGYFYTVLINGVVEILWNLIGEGWGYPLLVLFGNVACVVMVCFAVRKWQLSKGIYPVDIYFPDIIWTFRGFYDSGNCLKDPYTGKNVHIISEKLSKRLELNPNKKVCIPYQSLGNEEGIIDVYYVDRMSVKKQEMRVELYDVPLAVAKDSLFEGKGYDMIMNREVW